jgi:hypothetical protein
MFRFLEWNCLRVCPRALVPVFSLKNSEFDGYGNHPMMDSELAFEGVRQYKGAILISPIPMEHIEEYSAVNSGEIK